MNLIEKTKTLLTDTKNLKDSPVESLKECSGEGIQERILIIDEDLQDEMTYCAMYTMFGDTVMPYYNIEIEGETLEYVILELDKRLSQIHDNRLLLVTMEEIYESEDFTFFRAKGDFGDIYMKYKDSLCNLGINPDKFTFYLKGARIISSYEDNFVYEGIEVDGENDWKHSIQFGKYTHENKFSTSEFLDMIIELFLSENADCEWKISSPKKYYSI